MNENASVARSLAALGHEARLDIFRLLVKAGRSGLTVGQIAEHLELAASTLAHHLKTLVEADLVEQTRRGREVINTAQFSEMDHIIAFLTDQCCTGVATTSPHGQTYTAA